MGVINEPLPAPPLYRDTSLNPKSSARIRIILGLLSDILSLRDGPSCQLEDPSDNTGVVIFKIFGIAHTAISILFCQDRSPMNNRKNIAAVVFFILLPLNSSRWFTCAIINDSTDC